MSNFFELMKCKTNRLSSFKDKQTNQFELSFILVEKLVGSGFFYLNEEIIQCAFCRIEVNGWKEIIKPYLEHSTKIPFCPFLTEIEVENTAINNHSIDETKTGVDVCGNNTFQQSTEVNDCANNLNNGPKNPQFSSIKSRYQSYFNHNWNKKTPVSIDCLVNAGFFYIGMMDCVRCFYCDGGLCNWKIGDDPLIEHSNWFPNCEFIRINKSNKVEKGLVFRTENYLNVNNCLSNYIKPKVNIKSDTSVGEQIESQEIQINEDEKSQDSLVPLIKELNFDNKQMLCKLCYDRELCIVYLPCGHQLACTQCALCCKICPVCRQPIKKFVRTYFS